MRLAQLNLRKIFPKGKWGGGLMAAAPFFVT
jgi:hypothetical protein